MPQDPTPLLGLIDHTLLRPDATPDEIVRLCAEAVATGFFGVCVNPSFVRLAARELSGTRVAAIAVAGFPLGASLPELKAEEAARAFDDGAREVDVVMAIGRLRAGEDGHVAAELAGIVRRRPPGARIKVIVETALLDAGEKRRAARLVLDSGADFVKTSTGFAAAGATVEDVRLLREVVGGRIGVKAAGGIRDLAALESLVAAGASRIGTSRGLAIAAELARRPGAPALACGSGLSDP